MVNTYPCNPFPISSEQLHKGDNEDLQAQIDAIKDGSAIDSFGDVETALATKADNDVIAPEFDAEAGTYEIGDLVMYEGKLYEFTSAHETAGEWDPIEVTEKTVGDEIGDLKSGLSNNVFKSGDIISATTSDAAITTYGFIQHGTQVYVMIPVNKPISATSFTVTDIGSFFVRYDGHLVDALANITSIVSKTVLSNGCLQFAVNFNTGTFSGIENMPAIITINAKITFV